MAGRTRALQVVHVNFQEDVLRHAPEALLEAWPTMTEVATAVAQQGVHVAVVHASHTEEEFVRQGVQYRFVAERPIAAGPQALWLRVRRSMPKLSAAVASFAPHVIHVNGLVFPIETRYLALGVSHVPILVQDHASRPPPRWRAPVYRFCFKSLAGVAFTARAQAEPFLERGMLSPHIPVFEVLESSSRFSPGDREAARRVTGLRGDPCLLWVGRLDENKDPIAVLDALHLALPHLPDPHLWCCYTDAPLLDAVRARLARDSRLADRVHLLGRVPHERVQDLYRAADFFVLGSFREGSGYAVIEALACGTPPLITDIPSFRRITGEGAVGALSPPGDAAAMARALVAWSGRRRDALRQAARRHFEQELSFEVLGRQLRGVYETLAGTR